MAVDGSMLNKYVGKKIKIILVNEQGTLVQELFSYE